MSGENTIDQRQKALGKTIKVLRAKREMSREDLHKAAKLSYPYVSEIENGKKWPTEKSRGKIARAFDLELADLDGLVASELDALVQSEAGTVDEEPMPTFRHSARRIKAAPSLAPRSAEWTVERDVAQFALAASEGTDLAPLPEANIERLVEARVRDELRRWQTDVLPLLIEREVRNVLEQLDI